MNSVCVWRDFIEVDDGVNSSETDAARTFHTPKGIGACDEASRQDYGLEHRAGLSRTWR